MSNDHDDPAEARVTMAMLAIKLDAVIAQQAAQQVNADRSAGETRQEMRDLRMALERVPALIDEKLDKKMEKLVSKEAFDPIQRLVYGVVSVIGIALVGALMAVILSSRGVAP